MPEENNLVLDTRFFGFVFVFNFCYARFQMIIERMFSLLNKGQKVHNVREKSPHPFPLNVQRDPTPAPLHVIYKHKKGEDKTKKGEKKKVV